MKSTPRENLLRTLRRQGFEEVPIDSNGFCESQLEAFEKRFGHRRVWEYFDVPFHGVHLELKATYTDPRKLYTREVLPEKVDFTPHGVAHSHHEGCFHMTRMHHPLKGDDVTVEEIEKYPFPIVTSTQEVVTARAHDIQSKGFAALGGMACTIWETSWYMRSMEDLMVDMLTDAPQATLLFDRVTEMACQYARLYARAGVDVLLTGDDIGMQSTPMMDPDLWRKWIKPRFAKVLRAAREIKPDILVWYHSCGFVTPFLEDLIEIGVDILQPVQPECMDFADVYKLVGGRMSFWGTIGTQQVLPFGTPEEVRATVKRNLDICGPQGGIVIGPTHMVEPEVPWENLEAMRLAVKEYGK